MRRSVELAKPRGSYRKPDDEDLLPLVRRLVDERPTYGYRRITALANRELVENGRSRRSTTSASSASCGRTACCSPGTPVEGPAVSMTARWLSCARTCAGARTASRSPAGTARSSALAFIIDAHDREIIAWHAVAGAGISGSMVRDMMLEAVESRFAALQRSAPARMAYRQRQRLHGTGRPATSRPRSTSCPASLPSRARNRTASPRASSKPSSATMFA